MSRTVEEITVFLASPGDVPVERKAVAAAVEEINRTYGGPEGFVLTLKRWETHTRPAPAPRGGGSQDVIDAQIGDYDIFVGLMWTRFGTPTKKAGSGTEQEYDAARKAGRRKRKYPLRVMFYFRSGTAKVKAIDPDQLKAVRAFKAKVFKDHLAREYDTTAEFARLIREHLTHEARGLLARKKAVPSKTATSRSTPAGRGAPKKASARPSSASPTVKPATRKSLLRVKVPFDADERKAFATKALRATKRLFQDQAKAFNADHTAHRGKAAFQVTAQGDKAFEASVHVKGERAQYFRVEVEKSSWQAWVVELKRADIVFDSGPRSFHALANAVVQEDYDGSALHYEFGYAREASTVAADVARYLWERFQQAFEQRR